MNRLRAKWKAVIRRIGMLALLLLGPAALGQDTLPTLRAHSKVLDVQEGDRLLTRAWAIEPGTDLNVYDALRTPEKRTVTFITEVDSLTFEVEPGQTHDFIILLNGKEACLARLSTMARGFERADSSPTAGPVKIPMALRHGKLHLQGTINESKELDLIFDTGAHHHVLYPSALGKGVELLFEGKVSTVGAAGATRLRTSSDNLLEVAGLRWEHEPFRVAEQQADDADGILGYQMFEDKVVELDFERMLLILHDTLPAHPGFTRVPMPFEGPLTAVEVGLTAGAKQVKGLFVLSTGGAAPMTLNPAFAATQGLSGGMKHLGVSPYPSTGRGALPNDLALLPELTLAGVLLRKVPIELARPLAGDPIEPEGVLGLEVLSRFHTLLDYPRSEAYFKPNARLEAPFQRPATRWPWYFRAGLGSLLFALVAGPAAFFLIRRRRALKVAAPTETEGKEEAEVAPPRPRPDKGKEGS